MISCDFRTVYGHYSEYSCYLLRNSIFPSFVFSRECLLYFFSTLLKADCTQNVYLTPLSPSPGKGTAQVFGLFFIFLIILIVFPQMPEHFLTLGWTSSFMFFFYSCLWLLLFLFFYYFMPLPPNSLPLRAWTPTTVWPGGWKCFITRLFCSFFFFLWGGQFYHLPFFWGVISQSDVSPSCIS